MCTLLSGPAFDGGLLLVSGFPALEMEGGGSTRKILVVEAISRTKRSTLGDVKGEPSCGSAVEGDQLPHLDSDDSRETDVLPSSDPDSTCVFVMMDLCCGIVFYSLLCGRLLGLIREMFSPNRIFILTCLFCMKLLITVVVSPPFGFTCCN